MPNALSIVTLENVGAAFVGFLGILLLPFTLFYVIGSNTNSSRETSAFLFFTPLAFATYCALNPSHFQMIVSDSPALVGFSYIMGLPFLGYFLGSYVAWKDEGKGGGCY